MFFSCSSCFFGISLNYPLLPLKESLPSPLFLLTFPKKVSRLVESGANKSARDSNARTPLLYAAMAKNFHVFTYLLELSSPEELVLSDKEGYTALHIASSLGSIFFFFPFSFFLFYSFLVNMLIFDLFP